MNLIALNENESQPEPHERTAKIKQCGDRRAIEILFETLLDGDRVNLLLARIYSGLENMEREVERLSDADVARIVKDFRDSRRSVDGAT